VTRACASAQVIEQIVHHVQLITEQGQETVLVHLKPDALGDIRLRLGSSADGLSSTWSPNRLTRSRSSKPGSQSSAPALQHQGWKLAELTLSWVHGR